MELNHEVDFSSSFRRPAPGPVARASVMADKASEEKEKPQFRLFGVPVHISPSFPIILAVLGLTASNFGITTQALVSVALWVLIAGFAILVHEFGHAGMFRAFGHRTSVALYGMGGLTTSISGPPLTPGRDFLVSMAGPVAGFALGGIGLFLPHSGNFYAEVSRGFLLWATFGFGVLNLLPILPLDGGQATVSMLRVLRVPRAMTIGRVIAVAFCAFGLLWALADGGNWWLAMLALWFGSMNMRALAEGRSERSVSSLEAAREALLGGEPLKAGEMIRSLAARQGHVQGPAAELLAWSELAVGNVVGARSALERRPLADGPALVIEAAVAQAEGAGPAAIGPLATGLAEDRWLPPGVLLAHLRRTASTSAVMDRMSSVGGEEGIDGLHHLQVLAHAAGDQRVAAEAGDRAWQIRPDPRVGLVQARIETCHGHPAAAMDWLERVASLGVEGVGAVVDEDEVLNPLRTIPRFHEVRSRMR